MSYLIILHRLDNDGWAVPGGAEGAPGAPRVVRRRVVEAAEGAPRQGQHHCRRHPPGKAKPPRPMIDPWYALCCFDKIDKGVLLN